MLKQEVKALFDEQLANWEMARNNFEGLDSVQMKWFDFDGFKVAVQFNPARIASSNAKVDAKTIAERKCFLCEANRPAVQKGITVGDYVVLINPFPIFTKHLTIPRREHVDQHIRPYFADMLMFAHELPEYVIFYNGPKCGASAPDHMHFQGGNKEFLPLVSDYARLKQEAIELIHEEGASLRRMDNYLRTVYVIESPSKESATALFNRVFDKLSEGKEEEPMMNVVAYFEHGVYTVFVIPRKQFRPWQFTAEGDKNLMISPATVEVSGLFITPREEHFNRVTREDVIDIMEQISDTTPYQF